MLDIWGKNIRHKKITIKSFLEGNLVEEKLNSHFPSDSNLQLPSRASEYRGGQAASINKDQSITAVNDILPRAQACI